MDVKFFSDFFCSNSSASLWLFTDAFFFIFFLFFLLREHRQNIATYTKECSFNENMRSGRFYVTCCVLYVLRDMICKTLCIVSVTRESNLVIYTWDNLIFLLTVITWYHNWELIMLTNKKIHKWRWAYGLSLENELVTSHNNYLRKVKFMKNFVIKNCSSNKSNYGCVTQSCEAYHTDHKIQKAARNKNEKI